MNFNSFKIKDALFAMVRKKDQAELKTYLIYEMLHH
jgi:hypothetical protein